MLAEALQFPAHDTPRTCRLSACSRCHHTPLVVRQCPKRGLKPKTLCAVCEACGFHHRIGREYVPTEIGDTSDKNAPALRLLFKRMQDAEAHIREIRKTWTP